MNPPNPNINSGCCDNTNDENVSTTNSSVTRYIRNIPQEFDVFGFVLEPKQFLIVLLLALIMLGPYGSKYTCHSVSLSKGMDMLLNSHGILNVWHLCGLWLVACGVSF